MRAVCRWMFFPSALTRWDIPGPYDRTSCGCAFLRNADAAMVAGGKIIDIPGAGRYYNSQTPEVRIARIITAAQLKEVGQVTLPSNRVLEGG